MARKPNQSSGGGIVNRLQELESRFKQRMDLPTGAESDILERIGGAQQSIDAAASAPNGNTAQAAEDIAGYTQEIDRLYKQLAPLERGREVGATRSYISSMGAALRAGNLGHEVNSMASASSSLSAATSMMGTPTHQLEAMHAQAMGMMNSAASTINESAVNNPGGGLNAGALGQLGTAMSSAAQAQAALTMQRRMGMDINSRYMNSREAVSSISGYLGQKDLAADVRAGKMGNRADVEAGLRSDMSQIERFQGAQNKYAGDPEKFERFQRAIDKLTESASKAAGTLKEMDRQGIAGGGGGFLTNPKVQAGLQYVQMGAQLVGAVADQWTYTNPLREKQNQTAYANLANRQFDDHLSALNGDMSALRRLGGTYGDAWKEAKFAQTGSKISSGAGVGIAAATLAGTGVGIPIAAGLVAGALAVNHFAGSYYQQAGERGSAMAEAEIARQNALSHINDVSTQSYRDYATNIGQATVGLGSQRGWNFDILNNRGAIRNLASVGIDTNKAAQLTAMGVGVMGGEFSTNQLIRSGQARQAGIMNEQQYFQNMGALTQVGGNADKNLEEILKNAVANGMDNAKSVAQMVQATASMAAKTAGMGIDTAAGSQQTIAKMMDSLTDQGVPMNMRGATAQNTANWLDQTLGDTSLNLYSIGRFSAMRNNFKNASLTDLEVMSTLSAQDVQQLSGPGGEKYAKEIGIHSQLVDEKGNYDQTKVELLRKAQYEQIVDKASRYGRSESTRKAMLEAGSIDNFLATASPEDEQAYRRTQWLEKLNLGAAGAAVSAGGPRKKDPTKTGDGAGEIDNQAVVAAQGNAKLIEQGQDIIEALGGLKGLTDALSSVAKNFKPEEMHKGAQIAAKDFQVASNKFEGSVKEFANAVGYMASTKKGG